MKSPKIKPVEQQKVTPLPDTSGAQTMQAKFDALKGALSRRGRSSTLLTWGKRNGGGAVALSGRLSDVDGGRAGTTVGRL